MTVDMTFVISATWLGLCDLGKQAGSAAQNK